MRKIGYVVLLAAIGFASCVKNSTERDCSDVTVTAPGSEVDSLRSYLNENGINATEDPRGFFYIISSPGQTKPTVCNAITFNYVGKFTNGTQFDAASNVSYYLSQLIVGWQEAIPLIGTGGSMKLYLPPSLGYGNVANGSVPANSILVFDITLLGVN